MLILEMILGYIYLAVRDRLLACNWDMQYPSAT